LSIVSETAVFTSLKTVKMSSTSTSYPLACQEAIEENKVPHLLECSICVGINDAPAEDAPFLETPSITRYRPASSKKNDDLAPCCQEAYASNDHRHILTCVADVTKFFGTSKIARSSSEPMTEDPYAGYLKRIAADPMSILESGRPEFHELPKRQPKKKPTLTRQPAIEMDCPNHQSQPTWKQPKYDHELATKGIVYHSLNCSSFTPR
jgi:hypothetical protein